MPTSACGRAMDCCLFHTSVTFSRGRSCRFRQAMSVQLRHTGVSTQQIIPRTAQTRSVGGKCRHCPFNKVCGGSRAVSITRRAIGLPSIRHVHTNPAVSLHRDSVIHLTPFSVRQRRSSAKRSRAANIAPREKKKAPNGNKAVQRSIPSIRLIGIAASWIVLIHRKSWPPPPLIEVFLCSRQRTAPQSDRRNECQNGQTDENPGGTCLFQ